MLANIYNKLRRITTNQLYFPEIDGIRFVAILLVLLFHIHGYFAGKTTLFSHQAVHGGLLNTFLENGDRGVELFFVLSGFILCLPFAHHYISNGKQVLLKKYYLRRVTRLEPPYFLAMTGFFIIQLAMHVHPASVLVPSWLASLVYMHNAIFHRIPILTVVAWSLEVEIQFYLLAPLLFSLLKLPAPARRAIFLSATVAIVFAQLFFVPPFLSIYSYAQYFFIGILLADLYVSNAPATALNKKWMALVAAALLLAIVYWPFKDPLMLAPELFFYRLTFPFLIGGFYYLVMKNDGLKKIFSFKFIPIIGGMCYSIYLLHYNLISTFGRFTLRLHVTGYYLPNLLLQVLLLGIPVLTISAVYYYYVERPFMSSKWIDMLLKKDKHKEDANKLPEVSANQ